MFELQFCALLHMKLQKEQLKQGVGALWEHLTLFRCDEIIHSLYADVFVPGRAELAATGRMADQFAESLLLTTLTRPSTTMPPSLRPSCCAR
jgi:hypothetical protein